MSTDRVKAKVALRRRKKYEDQLHYALHDIYELMGGLNGRYERRFLAKDRQLAQEQENAVAALYAAQAVLQMPLTLPMPQLNMRPTFEALKRHFLYSERDRAYLSSFDHRPGRINYRRPFAYHSTRINATEHVLVLSHPDYERYLSFTYEGLTLKYSASMASLEEVYEYFDSLPTLPEELTKARENFESIRPGKVTYYPTDLDDPKYLECKRVYARHLERAGVTHVNTFPVWDGSPIKLKAESERRLLRTETIFETSYGNQRFFITADRSTFRGPQAYTVHQYAFEGIEDTVMVKSKRLTLSEASQYLNASLIALRDSALTA